MNYYCVWTENWGNESSKVGNRLHSLSSSVLRLMPVSKKLTIAGLSDLS